MLTIPLKYILFHILKFDLLKFIRLASGQGKDLQSHLIASDKQNKNTSYIHQPWTEIYQMDRRSVVLNHNPFVGFIDDPDSSQNTQLNRTTNLILSSMRFYRTYRDGLLEPDIYHMNPSKSDTEKFKKMIRFVPQSLSWYGAYLAKAFPLDMRQYPFLFQSTRIPKKTKDENRRYPDSKHIVVIHKGHFYSIDTLDSSGGMLDGGIIKSSIAQILDDPRDVNYNSIGYFTSMNRDSWAEVRQELEALNPELLYKIDSSMFVLCLDEYDVAKKEPGVEISEQDAIPLIKNGLHGEAYNRWFDKCFNMIVTNNGKGSIHFEHSWGDGVSVLRYFNEIYKDSIAKHHVGNASGGRVEKLDPQLSPNLIQAVEKAKSDFEDVKKSFVLDVMKFQGFGKNDLKKLKLSPDSICQLAFQMANWRFKREFVGSYESCSTAAFKFGRTETIRPCTKETKACSIAFDLENPANVDEMSELLRSCSKKHNKLTKEAAMGQGFDRHLFALKFLNNKLGGAPLPIFEDPNYAKLNYIVLSTSTLVSPALEVGGFAAVVPDGLGIGYAMFDDWFGTQASCYPPHNDGSEFIKELTGVCEDLKTVLSGKNFKEVRKI